MTLKDWIQIALSTVTALTSITAIVISIKSLNNTKRSIENANRPNVVAYLDWTWMDSNLREYLVIKNFGKSAAVIDNIKYSEQWLNSMNNQPIFPNMAGCLIAPGQKYVSLAEEDATGVGLPRARTKPITMTIDYSWDNQKKHGTFTHKYSVDGQNQFELGRRESGFSGENKELQRLLYRTAQEFVRRDM